MSDGIGIVTTSTVLDIVIPTARPVNTVREPLHGLRRAIDEGGESASVTVVDDRGDRPSLRALGRDLGFRTETAGYGVGPGVSRNLGASRGGAPWILFLDDDVELDRHSIVRARWLVAQRASLCAAIGGLRAPEWAPKWLHEAYRYQTMNAASAAAGSGSIPATHLSAALLLVRRDAFEEVGGFPPLHAWEDAVLGVRLHHRQPQADLIRDVELSGVHLNVPGSWSAWLERQFRAGVGLGETAAAIPAAERSLLVQARGVVGAKGYAKRVLASIPPVIWSHARSRPIRRVATSAMFARGYTSVSSRDPTWVAPDVIDRRRPGP